MSFGMIYLMLATIATVVYFTGKYSLNTFEKYATVDFEASRYTPPTKGFKVVGVAFHIIVFVAILAIVFI